MHKPRRTFAEYLACGRMPLPFPGAIPPIEHDHPALPSDAHTLGLPRGVGRIDGPVAARRAGHSQARERPAPGLPEKEPLLKKTNKAQAKAAPAGTQAIGLPVIADTAARQQAETALRESEERFAKVFRDAPVWIAITDLADDTHVEVNEAALRASGFTRDEVIGHTAVELGWLTAENRARLLRELQEHGRIAGLEMAFRAKDGRPLHGWFNGEQMVLAGRPCLLTVTIDITERRLADFKLRDALTEAQRFRQALDHVSAHVYLKDSQSRYVYANRATLELFGCSAAELVGCDDTRFFPPGTAKRLREIDSRVFRGESTKEEIDVTDAAGGWRVYLEAKSPIYADPGSKVIWGLLGISTNITERKLAEAALRESEKRYQRITTAITDYIYTVRMTDGRAAETTHGPGCLAVTGYDARAFANDPSLWLRLVAAADRPLVEEQARRILAGEDPPPIEHSLVHKNGTVRWVRNSFVPHREAHGALVAYDGLIQDITARKQAEAALQETNEQLRSEIVKRQGVELALRESQAFYLSLVDQLPAGVFRKDSAGRYVFVSPWFTRLKGLKAENFLGKTAPEVAASERARLDSTGRAVKYAADGADHHHLIMETGRPVELVEEYAAADGRKQFFHVIKLPVINPDGQVIGTQGILFDITDRKRAEEALRESEASLRESQIIAGLGSYVLDIPTGNWQGSDVLDQIFGIEKTHKCSVEAWVALIHPGDRAMMADYFRNEVLGQRQAFNKEYRIIRHDNQAERWVHGLGRLEFDPQGRPLKMRGTIQDITARRQAEAERRQLERKLQETQKLESLGVLAGGIAHDFNNILTSILGNATLASLDLPAGSPVHDNLETIKQGSLRAADLCKQMLAYSGKGRFAVQNLSLNRLVEETTHLLRLSINKQAVLRFNLYPALPAIEADPTQIRQVIMNLVINASEAIGEKSGVISLSTGLSRVDREPLGGTLLAPELPEGTYVYLEVADSGCGMSPEIQAKIFDPFFTTKFAGRGLGLAAVLGIVRGHKGVLRIHSEPGRGTTFKLLFPCATGGAELVAADHVAKPTWRGQGCVLVADDEESVRSTAALMLRRLGFEVALAADGREAVESFRADPDRFTLVLLDLTMPHLDGQQAFTELRGIRAEVRVVLMSGFNEQEVSSRFTGLGMAGFLQKPFQYEGLGNAVQDVLAGAPKTK